MLCKWIKSPLCSAFFMFRTHFIEGPAETSYSPQDLFYSYLMLIRAQGPLSLWGTGGERDSQNRLFKSHTPFLKGYFSCHDGKEGKFVLSPFLESFSLPVSLNEVLGSLHCHSSQNILNSEEMSFKILKLWYIWIITFSF